MGPTDRRQRELGEREKIILAKSRELFFKNGFDGVTIQDICEAVEYGKSVIYSMFESKEEIYAYVYIDAVKIISSLLKKVDFQGDFDKEFTKIGGLVFKFYNEYNDYYMATSFFNSLVHSKVPAYIKEEKEKLFEEADKVFEDLLEMAIEKGIIKNINIKEFITNFYFAIFGIIGFFIYNEDEEDQEKIKAAVMMHTELYKNGLKA